MLTRRYALYMIAAGLALLLAGVVLAFHLSVLIALLVIFNGLIVVGGGVWLWIIGRHAL